MTKQTGLRAVVMALCWLLAAEALALSDGSVPGERRVALVIGNAAYEAAIGRLPNPTNDAGDIAAKLEQLGFEVELAIDVDRDQMRRAVLDFGRKLRGGGVGLFYYAGHAIQVGGRNFMIPLGAELSIPEDADMEVEGYVELETVDVDQVLGRMGIARNRLNIVILDACRDNPFARGVRSLSRGLATMRAPTGTFIAYATAPESVAADGRGRNSPFTEALLTTLDQPGLKLEELFKEVRVRVVEESGGRQTPWANSSIIGEFYFRPPDRTSVAERQPEQQPAPPRPEPAAPSTPVRSTGTDVVVWNAIEDSANPADFELFLETYPDSPFAPFAKRRLQTLEPFARRRELPPSEPPAAVAAVTPEASDAGPVGADAPVGPGTEPVALPSGDPAAVEAALGLSVEQRREVQFALAELGHDPRGIDGVLGAGTRDAIRDWQSANGQAATGYLTGVQVAALSKAARAALARPREQLTPEQTFRDCAGCPEMVVVPAGTFEMGAAPGEEGASAAEAPRHEVTIPAPFAIGKYEVTFAQWYACVEAGGCNGYRPRRQGSGRHPAILIGWEDASAYAAWLASRTGQPYRLPSEAEWEYAARAGTTTPFATGRTIQVADANQGGSKGRTTEVGSYPANAFGLHDMIGNVWEWVEDCWNPGYQGAPADGAAWTSGDCQRRVLRGGSWRDVPANLRSASRSYSDTSGRYNGIGFRVARTVGSGGP